MCSISVRLIFVTKKLFIRVLVFPLFLSLSLGKYKNVLNIWLTRLFAEKKYFFNIFFFTFNLYNFIGINLSIYICLYDFYIFRAMWKGNREYALQAQLFLCAKNPSKIFKYTFKVRGGENDILAPGVKS